MSGLAPQYQHGGVLTNHVSPPSLDLDLGTIRSTTQSGSSPSLSSYYGPEIEDSILNFSDDEGDNINPMRATATQLVNPIAQYLSRSSFPRVFAERPSDIILHVVGDDVDSEYSRYSSIKSDDSFSLFGSSVPVFSISHMHDKLGNYHQTIPPSPLLPVPLSRSSPLQPSTQQVWLTIQNYSMLLNTMSLQSHENVNEDDGSAALGVKQRQHHYLIIDDKRGSTAHPAPTAASAASHTPPCMRPPKPSTRTYFTLCSLDEYISQFSLTNPHTSGDRKTDEYQRYKDLHSRFPPAIHTVTMTLYFLYQSPHIYLPLAPFRNAIYSAVELINTFWWGHSEELFSFNTICQILSSVLPMRIWDAVNRVYPHLKLGRGQPVPELELDRPPILEWLARDTLAAFNPIEIMLMFYRPIMAEYKQILFPTQEDHLLYFQKATGITTWLHDMHPICITCGLHIHDSQWVSMKEWKELAGYMRIIATKMAPNLFDVVQGKHPDPTTNEERQDISSAKSFYEAFLCCLAPCFTHHYRPMGEPDFYIVPFGSWPSSSSVLCSFPLTTYSDITTNIPPALEQYATMYAEDPQQFECEGSQAVSRRRASPPPSTQHHDSNGDNLHIVSPSSIRPAFDKMIKTFQFYHHPKQGYKQFRLELPSYNTGFPQIQFLLRAIVECPPVNDPVYRLFAPWFTHVTDHMRIMTPIPSSWVLPDPQLTYNPSISLKQQQAQQQHGSGSSHTI